MARLKFLVFALLVLAVWAAHLVLLTPPLVGRSVDLAMAQAQAARPLAQAQIGERRQLLQRAAAKLSAQPRLAAVAQALRAPGGVSPERLEPLRALAEEQAPEAIQGDLVVGYATESAATFFRGGEPAEGLDPALGRAGQDGMLQEAFGMGHLFISLPVWDRPVPEAKQVGSIVLGTPLLTGGMMDAVSRDAALAAAGVFQGGRLVQGGGPEKDALERAAKGAQLGTGTVVERGETAALGPLRLPLFTAASDRMGGRAPLLVASRQAIEDTPYEFIALTSVKPLMGALAGYQRFALAVFGGLFLLTLVWAALMGSGESSEAAAEPDESSEAEPLGTRAPEPSQGPAPESAEAPPPPETQLAAPMPDPQQQQNYQGDPRLDEAIARMNQRWQGAEGTPSPSEPEPPPEPPPEPATTAAEPDLVPPAAPYEAPPPAEDPFSQHQAPLEPEPEADPEGTRREESPFGAPGQELSSAEPERPWSPPPEENTGPLEMLPHFSSDPSVPVPAQDDNPDATRVATIPQELLAASARAFQENVVSAPRPSGPVALPKMPAVAAAQASSPEEAHFQEIFREFVATRERCGEGADGLTYDKFALKLRKNQEQLVQKYACKTVRFQVYVKDGKAALKATPVKD